MAADLSGADLSSRYARNTDFSAATVAGANLRYFDWFNAEGFTREQLRSAEPSTVDARPKDATGRPSEEKFRKQLDHEYAFKWDQLIIDQPLLLRVWTEYGKPGGLCDQVDAWFAERTDPTTVGPRAR